MVVWLGLTVVVLEALTLPIPLLRETEVAPVTCHDSTDVSYPSTPMGLAMNEFMTGEPITLVGVGVGVVTVVGVGLGVVEGVGVGLAVGVGVGVAVTTTVGVGVGVGLTVTVTEAVTVPLLLVAVKV